MSEGRCKEGSTSRSRARHAAGTRRELLVGTLTRTSQRLCGNYISPLGQGVAIESAKARLSARSDRSCMGQLDSSMPAPRTCSGVDGLRAGPQSSAHGASCRPCAQNSDREYMHELQSYLRLSSGCRRNRRESAAVDRFLALVLETARRLPVKLRMRVSSSDPMAKAARSTFPRTERPTQARPQLRWRDGAGRERDAFVRPGDIARAEWAKPHGDLTSGSCSPY